MRSGFDATLYCVLAALGMLFLSEVSSWAHKVNVFAYLEGDSVIVEGYFSGNVKAQDSQVEVFDSNGKKILEGKTDSKGIYSFNLADLPTVKGEMRIVLDAGMGHRADFTLRATDLPVPSQQKQSALPKSEEKVAGEPPAVAIPSIQALDLSELKKVLEQGLDQKIQPLMNMLGNQQKMLMEQKDKGPTVAEIVGGIGWIMGIVGVAGYFMGRKRKSGD